MQIWYSKSWGEEGGRAVNIKELGWELKLSRKELEAIERALRLTTVREGALRWDDVAQGIHREIDMALKGMTP
jgi:hypothetical protein